MALSTARSALRRTAFCNRQTLPSSSRLLHTSASRTYAAKVSPAELTKILSERISKFSDAADVEEVGRVLNVGDGIARVYGLKNVKAGEMVSFASGIKGMALNLETDNVGVVVFGDDRAISEGDTVARTREIVDIPIGHEMLGRVIDPLGRFPCCRNGYGYEFQVLAAPAGCSFPDETLAGHVMVDLPWSTTLKIYTSAWPGAVFL